MMDDARAPLPCGAGGGLVRGLACLSRLPREISLESAARHSQVGDVEAIAQDANPLGDLLEGALDDL